MCGIVGITGTTMTAERLVEGLQRLEYRGYDSAGLATVTLDRIGRRRAAGKIANLREALRADPLDGPSGIAHTRWATHGKPTEANAHPHKAGPVAIVHNGIIENFRALRERLAEGGAIFASETDSETIAHLIAHHLEASGDPVEAVRRALPELEGAFAIAVLFEGEPGLMIGARKGSPLVIGHGEGEMFLGSDAIALAPFTRRVTYLDEGDWAVLRPGGAEIFDAAGCRANRQVVTSAVHAAMVELGPFAHFMLKEIHEQPESLSRSLLPQIDAGAERVVTSPEAGALFRDADRAVATACGTAFYAAMTAKYWFERYAGLALETDIASEYRYRHPVLPRSGPALFVSQSGETADTLAALRHCKTGGAPTLAVVNVPESSIAREADVIVPTVAGPEIGVASTKAFTAQLAVLATLAIAAGRARGVLDAAAEAAHVCDLLALPRLVTQALEDEARIARIAAGLTAARSVLYLGRGPYYPIALEGALKLKEISYIHAEGYAAGELKHGPIALIEDGVPVIVIAPHDDLMEKTVSNMEEVRARGARVILVTDPAGAEAAGHGADEVLTVPAAGAMAMPILATVPIQLLAYHVALAKGEDVDQPRNLAKSVTVE